MNAGPYSDELHKMCLAHFNEPFISFGEIARCIGYGETAVDCYIIAKDRKGVVSWHTCVGGYTWLNLLRQQGRVTSSKGETWDDLSRLDSTLALNGCPPEEEFRLDLRHDDYEGLRAPSARTESDRAS